MKKQDEATDDVGAPFERHVRPTVWARKDEIQKAKRGGFLCAMYPNTDGREDLQPMYDEATLYAAIAAAWRAGYWHNGYTNDAAYADAQAEAVADELLGKWA